MPRETFASDVARTPLPRRAEPTESSVRHGHAKGLHKEGPLVGDFFDDFFGGFAGAMAGAGFDADEDGVGAGVGFL